MSKDFKDSHMGVVVYLTNVDCKSIYNDRCYKSVTLDDRFVIYESEKNLKSLWSYMEDSPRSFEF